MGIDTAHYHGWKGPLRPPALATISIVRVALLQLFRHKGYWFVLALAMLRFLLFFAVIYIVTQAQDLPAAFREGVYKQLGFARVPDEQGETGYIRFMDGQGLVVMILLALSGSLLVGADFRLGSLPFYLSRRIDRRHYIAGKLLAVSTVIALITVVPALVLFVEYGMFTSSYDYWLSNGKIVLGILGYGAVMALTLSIMLVTLAAYLERMAPIAIAWSSLFVMLGLMSDLLAESTGNRSWVLLNLWRDIRYVGLLWFQGFEGKDGNLRWGALWILVGVCSFCLAALVRRVRAVEVVT
jgi:ABC-2 type transport system permease protein